MQTAAALGHSPKFYQIHLEPDILEGWMLTKEWGFQGSPGRIQMKHFKTIDEAENAFEDSRDTQIKRGYRIVFAEGQPSPT